jgi:histidyl-tRNA synthetase
MIPDSEILKVVVEILTALPIGKFVIKLNHRKLLDATVSLSGIDDSIFKQVCSSVDKLDKEPWEVVRDELIKKGVTETQADKLWTLVQLKGSPWTMYEKLSSDPELTSNLKAKEALDEMKLLFEYLDILQVTDYMSFDLSLARGLDYYTGLIYEAVLTDTDKVGSICGGGRYDNLLGMFSSKVIPAVGVTIGIERIFNILEDNLKVTQFVIIFRMTPALDLLILRF